MKAPCGWAPASANDSRGPGAYCPKDNTYVSQGGACQFCGLRVPDAACVPETEEEAKP